MSKTAQQGQINKIATEIKSFIEDGMETTGLVCGDGSPAFGGTGSSEDFDGFEIYSVSTNDAEDEDMIESLPCIAFRCDRAPVEYTLDNNSFYEANITFEIRTPYLHTKTIDSTVHQYSELMNWYLERLQYILDRMYLTSVKVSGGPLCTGAMNMGRVDDVSDIVYLGQAFCNVQFLAEVS